MAHTLLSDWFMNWKYNEYQYSVFLINTPVFYYYLVFILVIILILVYPHIRLCTVMHFYRWWLWIKMIWREKSSAIFESFMFLCKQPLCLFCRRLDLFSWGDGCAILVSALLCLNWRGLWFLMGVVFLSLFFAMCERILSTVSILPGKFIQIRRPLRVKVLFIRAT